MIGQTKKFINWELELVCVCKAHCIDGDVLLWYSPRKFSLQNLQVIKLIKTVVLKERNDRL